VSDLALRAAQARHDREGSAESLAALDAARRRAGDGPWLPARVYVGPVEEGRRAVAVWFVSNPRAIFRRSWKIAMEHVDVRPEDRADALAYTATVSMRDDARVIDLFRAPPRG
jgi:hypothetical protein